MDRDQEERVKRNSSRINMWSLLMITLVFLIIVLILTNPSMVESLIKKSGALLIKGEDVKQVQEVQVERIPRPMPVVEDYFSKGWDFRARNIEEQVIVSTSNDETFESKLFKIASGINLCAHLGFAPPLVLVDSNRTTDTEIPDTYRDIPELLQDIFPKLKVLSVPKPDLFIKTFFTNAMILEGKMRRESTEASDFGEFPKIDASTIILTGHWESWEYVDDYRSAVFDQLEFHPVIYHHCRKTYPVLFDRRIPTRGIFLGDIDSLNPEEIKKFVSRNSIDNERIVVFLPEQPKDEGILKEIFGEGYESKVLVVVGECKHVQIYLGVFCRELLIDLTNFGWWVGFHAFFRGRVVYYTGSTESISLIEHYNHPSFRK